MERILLFMLLIFSINSFAKKNNFYLIDENKETGFAIYRTSKPNLKDMRNFCKLGIQEMMVLSANADEYEYKYAHGCPSLKVVFNKRQKAKIPVTKNFLKFFDDWVQEAKRTGKKIAFRCNCGCHRTGRLAAYYQMKYQRLTVKDAQSIMKRNGKWMWFFRSLNPQVVAMKDYIEKRACSTRQRYCVKE
ncbi:dual specificity protein phosphatase family protein [Bacteriovoracaceae bacterium]|nr:dual specificity protein phosphatase family protein [Bacteriovoracaceae bacterium]